MRQKIENRVRYLEGKPTLPKLASNGVQPGKWSIQEAKKYNPDADEVMEDAPPAADLAKAAFADMGGLGNGDAMEGVVSTKKVFDPAVLTSTEESIKEKKKKDKEQRKKDKKEKKEKKRKIEDVNGADEDDDVEEEDEPVVEEKEKKHKDKKEKKDKKDKKKDKEEKHEKKKRKSSEES